MNCNEDGTFTNRLTGGKNMISVRMDVSKGESTVCVVQPSDVRARLFCFRH